MTTFFPSFPFDFDQKCIYMQYTNVLVWIEASVYQFLFLNLSRERERDTEKNNQYIHHVAHE